MGSINWVGKSALAVLALALSAGAALAQENASAMDRVSIDARAKDRSQDGVRAMMTGDRQLHRNVRSRMLDWGTGGFELRGERLRVGDRSIDAVRHARWQRTYAADVHFRESPTPDIVFEAGARLERTNHGVVGGPLLTNPTKTVTQMAYVGVQLSHFASIRLIGFDNGGWSEGANLQLVSRAADGEPAARKGGAIEIGRLGSRPGDATDPQFKLRLERGRTAARSDTSATISWRVRL